MPKYVDPEQRVQEIVDAAIAVLSEGGFAKFTLRRVGERMGGSMTLVTHYFPNREALIEGILTSAENEVRTFDEEVRAISDPAERLRRVIEWAVPLDEDSLTSERGRIALLAHRDAEPAIDAFFARLEPIMRGIYREHVAELVDPEDLELAVDVMRSWISGIALVTIEHPEVWTRDRQLRVVDQLIAALPLTEPPTRKRLGRAG